MGFWKSFQNSVKESSIEWMIYANISVTTLFSQYFHSQGFTPLQIGILMALMPLISFISNPIFFKLGNQIGEKIVIQIVTLIPAVLIWGIFLLAGFWAKFLILLPTALMMSMVIPFAEGMVIQSLKRKGLRFDHVRLWGTIGYSLTIFMAGILVSYSFAWLFAFSTGALVVVGLVGRSLSQPIVLKKEAPVRLKSDRGWKTFMMMIVFAAIATSIGSMSSVFLPILTDLYQFPIWAPGVGFSIMAISEVPFLLMGERILKRLGNVTLMAIGVSAIGLRVLLMAWISNPIGFFLILTLHGVGYITIYYSLFQFIHFHLSNAQVRAAQVILWITLGGINFSVGSLGGGWLVDQLGVLQGFWISGGIGAAAAIGAWTYARVSKLKLKE